MAKNSAGMGRLTDAQCRSLGDGRWSDGGGLSLRVRNAGTPQVSRSWGLRFRADGKEHEIGLGSLADVSLDAARDLRHAHRTAVRSNVNPLTEKRAAKAAVAASEGQVAAQAAASALTLRVAAQTYHRLKIEPKNGNAKHQAQWLTSIENNLSAKLLDTPLVSVVSKDGRRLLMDELLALVAATPETGSRIKQRLGKIMAFYEVRGDIDRNPMPGIAGEVKAVGRVRGHHAALPYAEMPALMQALQADAGMAALAARFAILTAARTNEVLGASWSELDITGTKQWVIPAARMKMKREHVVPLSDAAIAVLHAAKVLTSMGGYTRGLVFPNLQRMKFGKPLSNMSMLAVLDRSGYGERTTMHGAARAAFSTRANELHIVRAEAIELALAHAPKNAVAAAYNRALYLPERIALLQEWAAFLIPPVASAQPAASRHATLPHSQPTESAVSTAA